MRPLPGIMPASMVSNSPDEFSWLPDLLAAGMTDYAAIISRFVAEGVIGEMDGVYTSWATRAPNGRPKSPRFSVSRHTSQQTA
jgi:hypothetical protein